MKSKLGFTLIEILLAIGLIALLFGIGAPTLIGWKQQRDLNNAAGEFVNIYYKSFYQSQSENLSVALKAQAKDSFFSVFVCESIDCKAPVSQKSIHFASTVTFDRDIDLRLIPPYGDVEMAPSLVEDNRFSFQVVHTSGDLKRFSLFPASSYLLLQ